MIAATNKDLERSIETGSFRNDLYYRLKVVTVAVPALRDRAEDIPQLVRHFLARFGREMGRDGSAISPALLERFRNRPWSGNVRELQGAIRQAIVNTAGHEIGVESWPSDATEPATAASSGPVFDLSERIESAFGDGRPAVYSRVMAEVERELLTRVLRRTKVIKPKRATCSASTGRPSGRSCAN